jgi:hypothetical protein
MALVAYKLQRMPHQALVCAPGSRAWMDATDERFAYRCLPLLIANQAGWFLLNDRPFEAMWDGGPERSGVQIRPLSSEPLESVTSHFGSGVITWHVSYLFRTPPGYNLLVRGPANRPKDGVQALEGLVESDWAASTFTMNWKFTRPNHWVRFDRGEPICMLVPQRRGELESFAPEVRDLQDDAEIAEAHRQWAESRARFLSELRERGSPAAAQKWQKHYFQGRSLEGSSTSSHQTVLTLRPFADATAPRADRRTGFRLAADAAVNREEAMRYRPIRQPDYVLERLDDEILLYHPGRTRALYLNQTAAVIWDLCDGERTTGEIIDLLTEAYPEAEALEEDVRATLRLFAQNGAVVLV